MSAWVSITDCGDSSIMVPAVLVIALWMLAGRNWKRAALWLGSCGAAMVLVAASKIAFIGWGVGIEALDFTGFSGHSMLSVAVLSATGWVLSEGFGLNARLASATGGLSLGLVIAVSRVVLHYHSPAEVVAGSLVGTAVAAGFAIGERRVSGTTRAVAKWPLILGLVLPTLPLHGQRAPSDQVFTALALRISGHAKPFTRTDWHRDDAPGGSTSAPPQGFGETG
jgi:hypothetical protein